MHRLDPELRALMEAAKQTGFLTFQMVDRYLPDEGGDPKLMEHLILALEETDLDLIEDPQAVAREQAAQSQQDFPVRVDSVSEVSGISFSV